MGKNTKVRESIHHLEVIDGLDLVPWSIVGT